MCHKFQKLLQDQEMAGDKYSLWDRHWANGNNNCSLLHHVPQISWCDMEHNFNLRWENRHIFSEIVPPDLKELR